MYMVFSRHFISSFFVKEVYKVELYVRCKMYQVMKCPFFKSILNLRLLDPNHVRTVIYETP